MKKLTTYTLGLLLLAGTTAALAGGRGHGGYHERPHWNHYKKHHYRPYRPHYRGPFFYRGRYPGYYYPPYVGAAIIGSALSFSLYHTHDGAHCYEDHGRSGNRYRDGGRQEIVGCHRIERLPDGRERRIEVPLSECH